LRGLSLGLRTQQHTRRRAPTTPFSRTPGPGTKFTKKKKFDPFHHLATLNRFFFRMVFRSALEEKEEGKKANFLSCIAPAWPPDLKGWNWLLKEKEMLLLTAIGNTNLTTFKGTELSIIWSGRRFHKYHYSIPQYLSGKSARFKRYFSLQENRH
jgi:hypothetical protein